MSIDALRQRCAAQDAQQDARLQALLAPIKRRRRKPMPAPSVWLRSAPSASVKRRSLIDGLYAEFGRKRTAAPHLRAANAFGGRTRFTPE